MRRALWGASLGESPFIRIDSDGWADALHMAQLQTVAGIAYAGIATLPEADLPDEPVLMRWAAIAESVEARNCRVNDVVRQAVGALNAHGIVPLLLKGPSIAQLYPQPMLRQSGDIDLVGDQAIIPLLMPMAEESAAHADDSTSLWMRGSGEKIEIEVHKRAFDFASPAKQKHLDKLMAHYPPMETELAGAKVQILAPIPNLLMQSAHILKHAMGHGIGLRQICDFAVSCQTWKAQVDAESFKAWSHQLGLLSWHRMLFSYLVRRLGMSEQYLPYQCNICADSALENIIIGGNFGHSRRAGSASGRMRKWHTAKSFINSLPFSLRCAPSEAFWNVATLLIGQKRC